MIATFKNVGERFKKKGNRIFTPRINRSRIWIYIVLNAFGSKDLRRLETGKIWAGQGRFEPGRVGEKVLVVTLRYNVSKLT